MKRVWYIWVAFGLCLGVVLFAMAWVSFTALRLERVEAGAMRQAAVEEKVRLALWRMESALTPLITREGARPYFAYSAFGPVNRAYTRMFAEIRPDEILVPSTLLTYRSPDILLHFQIDPSGRLSSPQAPSGNQRDLAETGYATHDEIQAASRRLAELKAVLRPEALLAALPEVEAGAPWLAASPLPDRPSRGPGQGILARQQALNTVEWQMRNRVQNSAAFASQAGSLAQTQAAARQGTIRAVRLGQELVLARRARIGGEDYLQGCWLNWKQIRSQLLAEVRDLLPEADLCLSASEPDDGHAYRLAALPVRLLPGAVPAEELPAPSGDSEPIRWMLGLSSPLRTALLIGWGSALVGAAAVVILLRGAVALSERRGAFVSAVTHELRTPLTTFRLYAEMLAEGMVADESKRADYLSRLRDQADRLSHLVENVLAYAQLSRGKSAAQCETVALSELVQRIQEPLTGRAERADMELLVESAGAAAGARVRADVSAVEQILLNLVDNACKYAARATDRRIHLQLGRQGRFALIRVCDHGLGISKAEAKRLFRPFHKSARQAAASAPGVGLGLALSRRLARQMHGDLRLDEGVRDGACFVLSLELAEPDARQGS